MNRPLAVVVGFAAKLPVAGMGAYNFHYIAGLRELGYDVHYVERVNGPEECYEPDSNTFGDDPTYGLRWLAECMKQTPTISVPWTFIDHDGNYHGIDRAGLIASLKRADFVLTLADATWFDDLDFCPRRAFVDGDPLFTQAAMLEPESSMSAVTARYPTLFTYWTRQNAPDTTVPSVGREWISTTPVVATALWRPSPLRPGAPITTVMNWGAWSEVAVGGVTYGHKNREFERFISFPSRTTHPLAIAVGGPAPKQRLTSSGWILVNPLVVTRTLEAYREFVDSSYADFGIAKHAYVASRSGWFSDRSTCYLASGRPVLHQDTGFSDWLPCGEGIFAFSNEDDVIAALDELAKDYDRHARAARAIAEDTFEAHKVIGTMLDAAGFR